MDVNTNSIHWRASNCIFLVVAQLCLLLSYSALSTSVLLNRMAIICMATVVAIAIPLTSRYVYCPECNFYITDSNYSI